MAPKKEDEALDNIYDELCSYENLELAFNKARRGKTLKTYVIEFEENLKENLLQLRNELLLQAYKPQPLKTFILRDPKTRKISKSAFRDRIVHHAICNVIESAFEKRFIYDSYANRLGKGTLNAIKRFDTFKRKASKNNSRTCYVPKADVKHYFETVDHNILLSILKKRIADERVLWLIKLILANHNSNIKNKGMPLGNLTFQFFANVYLNELDQFVKHKLRAKYYIRYVDDFAILHRFRKPLEIYKEKINGFLKEKLALELHPDISQILKLHKGIGFLGFRIFFYHKLIRKKNLRKFERRFEEMKMMYRDELISELTARQEKLAKENEAVSKELKEIKQEARDVVLKEQIEAEEKLGILEVSKEQRLAELRELDEAGGFDLYAKQTKKMLELHKSVGERKTLINNSNQAADRKQEIAQALGISL